MHVRTLGIGDAADPVIQERALHDGRIVVSRDGDFATLLAHSGATTPSFVHLRIPGVNKIPDQVALLLDVLAMTATELAQGAIVTVREGRIRIRTLPIQR